MKYPLQVPFPEEKIPDDAKYLGRSMIEDIEVESWESTKIIPPQRKITRIWSFAISNGRLVNYRYIDSERKRAYVNKFYKEFQKRTPTDEELQLPSICKQ